MNSYPLKKDVMCKSGKVEVLNPVPEKESFVSFSYSYKSMSFADGKTHIHSRKESFRDGKFESEEFEGTAKGDFYTSMAKQMEQAFRAQLSLFFQPFSFFCPFQPERTKKSRENSEKTVRSSPIE